MTLEQANNRLEQLSKTLGETMALLQKTEYQYQIRFAYLVTHSGMGNAQAREAEAITICDQEGLYQPLLDLRGEYKSLYQEKDCLVEISRNLRALQVGQDTE